MIRRVEWWVAISAALLIARPGDAQSFNFGAQCTTGAFQACASVHLWNETDPATGHLLLFIQIANLQGTAGFESVNPNALGVVEIRNLLVEDPTPFPFADFAARSETFMGFGSLSGNTYYCLTPGNCAPDNTFLVGEYWTGFVTDDRPGAGFDGDQARIINRIQDDSGNPIWGCTEPEAFGTSFRGPGTCNGWVTWRGSLGFGAGFRLTKDVTVALSFVGYDAETGQEFRTSCTTGVDCVVVTPEPGTLILLATGLAGIAAARRRRKKARVAA